jgi:hypothetical protein
VLFLKNFCQRRDNMHKRTWYILLTGILVVAISVGTLFLTTNPAYVRWHTREGHLEKVGNPGDESKEAQTLAEQFAQARTAPGIVLPGAYSAAFTSLQSLPTYGRSWTEVTVRPYDSDDPRYRDPNFSNSGGGAGIVSGRVTGLAVGNGYIYAGGADGGIFRSNDEGATWTPLTDGLPTLSTGDLAFAPDGALWLATGEGNTGATSYVGSGVYRLANPQTSTFSVADRVGGTELESTFINQLKFDDAGNVYAATSRGLWKHAANTKAGAWTRVLYPVSDPADPTKQSPYNNICNDVEVQPGTTGQLVIANCAWRGGASYNGFYLSTDGGNSFAKVNPTGALNAEDVGNTEFAYSADGKHLYAVVESIGRYTHTANTVLAGVYDSPTGNLAGPWNKIADSQKLASSGSALKLYIGYRPGVQAWYNNFVAVDPANSKHVFVGLEEVFETKDGGVHWKAIGPYWNFGFSCWSYDDTKNTCDKTTHPDQHSVAVSGGKLYVGNDGGVYMRNLDGSGGWQSLNANLRVLQYYSVGVGRVEGGIAVAGGLQDNGGSLLLPGDTTMVSPFGGDGGDIIVDPDDGCKILDEYVYLDLWITTTCGASDGSPGSNAITDVAPGDPNPRFIAPFEADGANKDHWVAGGQYIWTYDKGFALQSGSEWVNVFNQGAGHSTTAIASYNDVVWTSWCGPCNNDGFARGVSTNAGGTWHQVDLTGTPNRYIAGIAVDPADPTGNTAYLGFNGFSRRFTEGPGVGIGHIWKTTDAGVTWTDISGNFPDVPVNDIVLLNGKLIVATDLATLISSDGGATWSRLGSGLPVTTVMDLTVGPDSRLYAATHGRGIWSIIAP